MTRNDDTTVTTTTCRSYILAELRRVDHALTYRDLKEGAKERFSYGTLRNNVSRLKEDGLVIAMPKECPVRLILSDWMHRPEYLAAVKNDKKGMGGKFDFLSFLEGLGWESALSVHALKLRFEVCSFGWLGNSWTYGKRSRSYRRRFVLSYPVSVQCFDTGTVLVSVKASARPFRLDLDGLLSLTSLLGELRACLRAPCIPEPSKWLFVQWHLNRDSEEISVDGLSFHVTFRDFFNDVARVYFKHELNRVRAEAVQSPKRTMKDVFENVLNRDQALLER
jgi:hypothetical protein